MKNKIFNSIVYRTAVAFSFMSLIILWILTGVSYFFLSSQYTRNIKTSLLAQYNYILQEINENGEYRDSNRDLGELNNDGFVIFFGSGETDFLYNGEIIPFIKGGFYTSKLKNNKVSFYTDYIQNQQVFVGKKTDVFDKTKSEFITILIVINTSSILVLIILSIFISKSILLPISNIANYLYKYRFDTDNPQKLNTGKQFFEIDILTNALDTALHYSHITIQKEKEFLQDASHELRTPLMGISSSIELLQNTILSPEQKNKVDIIHILSQKLHKITDELLFLTRGGKEDSIKTSIDIDLIILDILDTYSINIEKKELHISCDIKTSVSYKAHEIDMQKLFGNLIDNSIKYTPNGGTIKIILGKDCFILKDSGIGMSPEFMNKLGDRFIRDSSIHNINYEGVGLGLSIVYKLIQKYGWHIDIQSTQHQGTSIKITFS